MVESPLTRIALRIATGLTLAFIYLPLAVITLYAFNDRTNQAWPSAAIITNPLRALAFFKASSPWAGVCTIGEPTLRDVFTETSTPRRRPIAFR